MKNLTASVFVDIAIIFIATTIALLILKALKQPKILAYIITGLAIGPYGFALVQNTDLVKTLAEIGIAFLLFIVGLELNLKRIKEAGKAVLIATSIQVAAIFGFTTLISYAIGCTTTQSLLLGVILAFSSTAVVVKILIDKTSEHLQTLLYIKNFWKFYLVKYKIIKDANLLLQGSYSLKIRYCESPFKVFVANIKKYKLLIINNYMLTTLRELPLYSLTVDLKGKTVLDVGAFIGDTPIWFLSEGASFIIAYEPHPLFYKILQLNIKINHLEKHIYPVNEAINTYRGYTNLSNEGVASRTCSAGRYKIRCEKFENAIKTWNPDIIKIDCEGCEQKILTKASPSILKNVPTYIVEIHGSEQNILNKFQKIGYKWRKVHSNFNYTFKKVSLYVFS